MEHDLKTAPEHFEAVWSGAKTAELRKDDRGFRVGDVLRLREWDGGKARAYHAQHKNSYITTKHLTDAAIDFAYTGRELRRTVTHVLRGEPWLAEGYVMLSLAAVDFLDLLLQGMTADEFAVLIAGHFDAERLIGLARQREGDALLRHVMYPNEY